MRKKSGNMALRILAVFFVIFMGLFIANASGYYESRIRNKVMITEKGIKDFETKVQNGEEIDITSFLSDERVDYSSSFSKVGEGITNNLEGIISKGMQIIGKIINSLF